jgi:cytochrome c-type biogenesis protein CcmH/NrfG
MHEHKLPKIIYEMVATMNTPSEIGSRIYVPAQTLLVILMMISRLGTRRYNRWRLRGQSHVRFVDVSSTPLV